MSSTTQLYASLILTAYLAPCAWQDWRTRKVSNWLTVPAFVAAWPLALWFGNLEWTVAVFLGCYVAWQFKGMGAADGKLATLMAAISPVTVLTSLFVLAISFSCQWFAHKRKQALPAAVACFAAALLVTIRASGMFAVIYLSIYSFT